MQYKSVRKPINEETHLTRTKEPHLACCRGWQRCWKQKHRPGWWRWGQHRVPAAHGLCVSVHRGLHTLSLCCPSVRPHTHHSHYQVVSRRGRLHTPTLHRYIHTIKLKIHLSQIPEKWLEFKFYSFEFAIKFIEHVFAYNLQFWRQWQEKKFDQLQFGKFYIGNPND